MTARATLCIQNGNYYNIWKPVDRNLESEIGFLAVPLTMIYEPYRAGGLSNPDRLFPTKLGAEYG